MTENINEPTCGPGCDGSPEEWRLYFDGYYEVSNHGRVRRAKPGISTFVGRLVRPTDAPTGYSTVCMSSSDKTLRTYLHKVVIGAFVGPKPPGHVVNHKDAQKQNNHLYNLEYVTSKENNRHAREMGLIKRQNVHKPPKPLKGGPPRGDKHWSRIHPEKVARGDRMPHTKLTWEDVREIRRLARCGTPQIKLCEKYGISPATMSRVVLGKRWKEEDAPQHPPHIDEPTTTENTTMRSDYASAPIAPVAPKHNGFSVLDETPGNNFWLYQGDNVEILAGLPESSVGCTVTSVPFSSLYVYSASDRDGGNVKDDAQFFAQFDHLLRELLRVTKPGRSICIHCMDLPTSKERDGYVGLRDFRGDIIRAAQKVGFLLHSQATIWKDPVAAVTRTHALGLLYKQLLKDSSMSRMGIPDYVVVLRKPGENAEFIAHDKDLFPVEMWQKWASPVWMDINPSDTLQYRSAREHDQERHIAPLQLEVIRRCLRLWSNPGDVVLDPYGGIGSTGVVALELGRKAVLAELKRSYYLQAAANLLAAEKPPVQTSLFDETTP